MRPFNDLTHLSTCHTEAADGRKSVDDSSGVSIDPAVRRMIRRIDPPLMWRRCTAAAPSASFCPAAAPLTSEFPRQNKTMNSLQVVLTCLVVISCKLPVVSVVGLNQLIGSSIGSRLVRRRRSGSRVVHPATGQLRSIDRYVPFCCPFHHFDAQLAATQSIRLLRRRSHRQTGARSLPGRRRAGPGVHHGQSGGHRRPVAGR